jgi:surface carbohydrate biosynthesis protein
MYIKTEIILLYSDSLRRDFSTCYIIKKILRYRGYRSFICSRRNFSVFLTFLRPKKVFVIGQINMVYAEKIIQEAKEGKIEIHFMPAEGFAMNSEYVVMYPKEFDYSFLTSIFFWGSNSMEWFRANRKIDDPGKLHLTGYARLPIAEGYLNNVRREKSRIGIIGRFPVLNDIYKRSTMSFCLVEHLVEERTKVLSRIDAESRAIIFYMDLFDEILNDTNYIISLRPHPNEDSSTYSVLHKRYGDRFELNFDLDVADWMSSCDKIMGLASSSYIDAFLVKKPVICLDLVLGTYNSTLNFDPALEFMYQGSYLPKDRQELLILLKDKDLSPVTSNSFKELISSDFVGGSEIVFDSIVSKILFTPTNAKCFDFIVDLALKFLDFILATRHKFMKNNSLQFDYSSYYHEIPENLELVASDIVSRIK